MLPKTDYIRFLLFLTSEETEKSMLVQFYNPPKLPGDKLDLFLEDGWFRTSLMLHKSKVIALDYQLYSIVNIRYNLYTFHFKKRHRKLWRKVMNRFTVEINPFSITPEKNEVYRQHKNRFKGFIHDNLEQLMFAYDTSSVFDSYEIAVYDGTQLVAFSFFDLGKHSMASIISVYDQNYSSFSLGIFTMLAEIQFGIDNNYHWYYPGYVLDQPSEFDYKLSLGSPEYRSHDGFWTDISQIDFSQFEAQQIKQKHEELEKALEAANISFIKRDNPYFTLSYIPSFKEEVLKASTVYLLRAKDGAKDAYCIEYISELKKFQLSKVFRNHNFDYVVEMEITSDLKNSDFYLIGLWSYEEKFSRNFSANQVVKHFLANNF